jgi:hypothetical protein
MSEAQLRRSRHARVDNKAETKVEPEIRVTRGEHRNEPAEETDRAPGESMQEVLHQLGLNQVD